MLADEFRRHPAVLVAGFSREAGNDTGAWVTAILADNPLAGVPVYQIAQITRAPGMIRGIVRHGFSSAVRTAPRF